MQSTATLSSGTVDPSGTNNAPVATSTAFFTRPDPPTNVLTFDGNSNAGEAKRHSCIKSEDNSKTGGKTEVEPSESECEVGEKGQSCTRKKGFRASQRKRAERINRQHWQC
jgi:hypothetical protein